MRLELTGRHVEITPGLRRLLDTKLSKLERVLNDHAVSAQAVLTLEKHRHRADITLHARGEKFLHGVGSSSSWEPSVAEAIAKIAHQAQKVKGKWQQRKRRLVRAAPLAPAAREEAGAAKPARAAGARSRMPRILRASRQSIKPMSIGDAAREIDAGGDVVIFRDIETASVTVLYRRRDGDLALVETEA